MSVRRVADIAQYPQVLREVREAGRTPLVVSSLQNPIETLDCIEAMGWGDDVVRNVWLRTVAKVDTHALAWLRDTRSGHREHYEYCLQYSQPWVVNVLLDDDEDDSEEWPHHYDPDFDFLFGKAGPGLPSTVWEGHKIFNSIDTVPAELLVSLKEHLDMEMARKHSE